MEYASTRRSLCLKINQSNKTQGEETRKAIWKQIAFYYDK